MVHHWCGMFGHRLRDARERAGLTQGELAAVLGVDRNTVGRAELGRTAPSAATVAAWARACGVSADALLGLERRARRA